MNRDYLSYEEEVSFALRRLYGSYGYASYKMSKFEEYDLYARNKSFLVSDSVLTFTDTTGKLMALKPDVTLSIVRASREGQRSKVFYNEKVYRPGKNDRSFREITQVGLEYIGEIDDLAVCEVLDLAQKSLKCISEDYSLDVSHLDLLSFLLDKATGDPALQEKLLACIGRKNAHDLRAICRENGVSEDCEMKLARLCSLAGSPEEILETLSGFYEDEAWQDALAQFKRILSALDGGHLRVDFSVINDRSYYNGIAFKGFVKGIPDSLLSGGRYDRLMRRMGKSAGALGFAVYLDEIERLGKPEAAKGADLLLLYDDAAPLKELLNRMTEASSEGKTVLAARELPDGCTAGEILDLRQGGARCEK